MCSPQTKQSHRRYRLQHLYASVICKCVVALVWKPTCRVRRAVVKIRSIYQNATDFCHCSTRNKGAAMCETLDAEMRMEWETNTLLKTIRLQVLWENSSQRSLSQHLLSWCGVEHLLSRELAVRLRQGRIFKRQVSKATAWKSAVAEQVQVKMLSRRFICESFYRTTVVFVVRKI